MSDNNKLKMYVWQNVLCDYHPGIAVALAYSAEQAKEELIKAGLKPEEFDGIRLNIYSFWLGEDQNISNDLKDLHTTEPIVVDEPKGFFVRGGD